MVVPAPDVTVKTKEGDEYHLYGMAAKIVILFALNAHIVNHYNKAQWQVDQGGRNAHLRKRETELIDLDELDIAA